VDLFTQKKNECKLLTYLLMFLDECKLAIFIYRQIKRNTS